MSSLWLKRPRELWGSFGAELLSCNIYVCLIKAKCNEAAVKLTSWTPVLLAMLLGFVFECPTHIRAEALGSTIFYPWENFADFQVPELAIYYFQCSLKCNMSYPCPRVQMRVWHGMESQSNSKLLFLCKSWTVTGDAQSSGLKLIQFFFKFENHLTTVKNKWRNHFRDVSLSINYSGQSLDNPLKLRLIFVRSIR